MKTAAGASAVHVQTSGAARRPNVVLILTDDQGYGDLSVHDNPYLKTPNIDRLAGQGVEMTRFYVSPVCAPTRSSLLTGRYNLRCGVYGVTRGYETMRTEETTLAEALGGAGYRTGMFGKWHLGEHYPYVPHAQGFDEFIGFRTGHWLNYFDSNAERNGKPYRLKGYVTDALTNEAMRFVEQNRDRPFLLYLPYNVPHSPLQAPARHFEPFRGRTDISEGAAAVYAMVSAIDENVGRLMAKLDELRLADNTIVIFLSDNGPAGQRYNRGLRGGKGTVYEGGVRVPFFARWPGRLKAGRKVDTIAAHIDVYPTLLDLCGVPRPSGLPIDGLSIRPLLEGTASNWPDRMLFTHREREQDPSTLYPGTVRTQRFNLVNGTELYEIPVDPGEQTNVAAQHPETVQRLRAAFETWYGEASRQCMFLRRPIPVGYLEENPVRLSAPQSYFGGNIKYHNSPAGFAHDWLTNWTSTDDWVEWDIHSVHEGRYEVTLVYLCPQADVGAKVAVSCGDRSVEAVVNKATSMTPRPNPAVVPQPTYPEMDFATLAMGNLEIPAGRGRLRVKASSKAGATVMDLQEIRLRRLE